MARKKSLGETYDKKLAKTFYVTRASFVDKNKLTFRPQANDGYGFLE